MSYVSDLFVLLPPATEMLAHEFELLEFVPQ